MQPLPFKKSTRRRPKTTTMIVSLVSLTIIHLLPSFCCVDSFLILPIRMNHYLRQSIKPSSLCIAATFSDQPTSSSSHQLQSSRCLQSSSTAQHRLLNYTTHWSSLLQLEHTELLTSIHHKRSTYSTLQLESEGLVLENNVCAEPEGEVLGEKMIRLFYNDDYSFSGSNNLSSRRKGSDTRNYKSNNNNKRNNKNNNKNKKFKWREKFNRGDLLLITPLQTFRTQQPIHPKEGLVTNVGSNHLTLSIGSTTAYPPGLFEMRKHYGQYLVKVEKCVGGSAPLKAQRLALERLRKSGEGVGKGVGSVARLLVDSFYNHDNNDDDDGAITLLDDTKNDGPTTTNTPSTTDTTTNKFSEVPPHFKGHAKTNNNLQSHIQVAMKQATATAQKATTTTTTTTSFEPNESQKQAVEYALRRSIGLIRGPPGTGKTRVASLVIATALKMEVCRLDDVVVDDDVLRITNDDADADATEEQPSEQQASEQQSEKQPSEQQQPEQEHPRVLAVTHSNGAADVLLQALLDRNVPAVRHGRPASVSPSVQHRTIVALCDRMPEVIRLRQEIIASEKNENNDSSSSSLGSGSGGSDDDNVNVQERQRQSSSASYDIKQYTNEIQNMILRTAPVVVTTCIGAQQLLSDETITFPIVVLDEAAQTTEPALMCALTAARADQLIMVGDTQQLPPTVTSRNVDLRKSLGRSPMERLLLMKKKCGGGAEEFVLREQYRMPESLLKFPNEHFYDSLVKCADSIESSNNNNNENETNPKGFPWPNKSEPLAFLQVGNDSEVSHNNFGGRSNPKEVQIILDIVLKFLAAGDVRAENIAIITPYSKQVQLLRAELTNASIVHRNGLLGGSLSDVQVGSVDSFQGQEKELVLFSAVRSNRLNELGFLRDARRLNVAITRAKRGLIVVGDSTVLKSCRHWAALLDSCRERGCCLTEGEYYSEVEESSSSSSSSAERGRRRSSIDLSEFELDMEDEYFGLFSTSS